MNQNWMIYGANGETGELIARKALAMGLRPILAGRNQEAVEKLAAELGFESRVFSLDDTDTVRGQLSGLSLVAHCAGPFLYTAKPMVEACIAVGCHYVDITGELDVFEMLYQYHEIAKAKGIMILSGGGFDIVPTDCMALSLKEQLPDATSLSLGLAGTGSYTLGTVKSLLLQLAKGGFVRKDGKIEKSPVLSKSLHINLGDKPTWFYSVPLADVFTAYITTGIANITLYMALPKGFARFVRAMNPLTGLLKLQMIRKLMLWPLRNQKLADEQIRKKYRFFVWGRATADDGRSIEELWMTGEAYNFTAESVNMIAKSILDGKAKPGFQTPSLAFGSDFALTISKSRRLLRNGERVK